MMSNRINNNNIPSIAELMDMANRACKPEEINAMLHRIEQHKDKQDYLAGAWLFLQDHANDFSALSAFLASSSKINTTKINARKRVLQFSRAAAIFLALLLGKLSYDKWIYQTTLKEYLFADNSITVFATGTTYTLQKDAIINAYKTENTKQGIDLFEKLDTTIYTDTLCYVAGLLYLHNKEYSKSIAQFKRIHTTSMYGTKAKFFMSIDLICLNRKEEAKSMLTNIQTTDDEYLNGKIQKLLNEELIWEQGE